MRKDRQSRTSLGTTGRRGRRGAAARRGPADGRRRATAEAAPGSRQPAGAADQVRTTEQRQSSRGRDHSED